MTETDLEGAELALNKRLALSYMSEAFAEAELDGLDDDCIVQAALFTAFRHLVEIYGEEPAATYAEGLPARIRSGGFTTTKRH